MAVKKKFPYRAAVVACNGGCRSAEGEAGCADGCIGCKACVDKCKFGAISINEYGVAEVDEEKCIHCGKCKEHCPTQRDLKENFRRQVRYAAQAEGGILRWSI